MSSVYDWSTTPASNASSDAAMTWAEGQAPSTVNNSARQLVARVAELLGDIDGSLSAGGTSSALTVTANSAFTTYANGRIIAVKASVDNAASATLNVNGIGAKSIRKFTPTEAALAGGEMKNTGIYLLMYNTALNSAAGGWHLLSPSLIEVVAATTAVAGIVELATDAEAIARSDTARAVTPANLAAAIGPASSTDNAIARFDSTSGKLQNSGVTIDDSNNVTAPGSVSLGSASEALLNVGTSALSTGSAHIEIGAGRTGDGFAYVDFHAQTGTDQDARIIRNGGANGSLAISNNGSGGISVTGNTTITGTLTVTG